MPSMKRVKWGYEPAGPFEVIYPSGVMRHDKAIFDSLSAAVDWFVLEAAPPWTPPGCNRAVGSVTDKRGGILLAWTRPGPGPDDAFWLGCQAAFDLLEAGDYPALDELDVLAWKLAARGESFHLYQHLVE